MDNPGVFGNPARPVPVRLIVGNCITKIDTQHRWIITDLDENTAVEYPGSQFMRARSAFSDGYWHPVNVARGTFPTGLLDMVRAELPMAQVVDQRIRPPTAPFTENIIPGLVLAEHQKAGIQAALEKGRGILAHSMSAGKTPIGIVIATHVAGKCVWMVHRKDLLYQVAAEIKRFTGEEAVLFGDGQWGTVTDKTKFVVIMPQTVDKDIRGFVDGLGPVSMIILDEVHRTAAGQSCYKVAQFVDCYYKIGLSGTVDDLDDDVKAMRVVAATGAVIHRVSIKDLEKLGWTTPCKVVYHKMDNRPLPQGHDWDDAKRILIVENPERNAEIVWLAMEAAKVGKPCLVICDSIRHVRYITEILRGEGIRVRMLTGKNASATRIQAKKDISCGALEVLVTSIIFDEGISINELEVLILGAGGKSGIRFLQRAGRLMRKHEGKEIATIHDFLDTGSRYVLRHSVRRISIARREGFQIENLMEMMPYIRMSERLEKKRTTNSESTTWVD